MSRFAGKRVLITGGTSGIGLATAKRIAAEGGKVLVTGTNEKRIAEANAALPEGSHAIANDAGDPAAIKPLADAVKQHLGTLDGLFLNAGFGAFQPIETNDQEFWDRMNHVNVRGPVLQMRELKPLLNDGAAVLLTSSVAPYLGQPGGAVYGSTKAANAVFARSWASELASRNIRVNSIAPGPIDTNFFEGTGMSEAEKNDFIEGVKANVPLGRLGTSEEVAAVATFLLSDDASYVTASEYFVDGGIAKI